MSEQKNSSKGFLKDKLGDYQVVPPDKVWDSISSQLGGRNRRTLIIITLSAAATIALAITLGINYFSPSVQKNPKITETLNITSDEPNEPKVENNTLEKEKETMEEKVVRILEEVAEESPSEVINKPNQVISRVERSEQVEISDATELMTDLSTEEAEVTVENLSDLDGRTDKDVLVDMDEQPTGEELSEAEDDPSPDPEDLSPDPEEDLSPDPEDEVIADPIATILEEDTRDPRWIVGAAISPLYSFRDAEASAMAGASEFESGMVAYAGGVHVSYKPVSRLAIESGVFFNKLGISIGAPGIQLFNRSFDFSPLVEEASQSNVTTITNSVGNIIATSGEVYVNNYKLNAAGEANDFSNSTALDAMVADQGIRQHLDYLELPFNLRYTVVDRTIELQLVGGISTNFLVNSYVTMETSEGPAEIGYLTNIRSVNYSGNAGLGMIYHVHKQISIRMEPRFRYFLNSVNDASLPSTRPYTLGLFTGLSYTF